MVKQADRVDFSVALCNGEQPFEDNNRTQPFLESELPNSMLAESDDTETRCAHCRQDESGHLRQIVFVLLLQDSLLCSNFEVRILYERSDHARRQQNEAKDETNFKLLNVWPFEEGCQIKLSRA